jgi:hypothetical protein
MIVMLPLLDTTATSTGSHNTVDNETRDDENTVDHTANEINAQR